MKKDKFHGKTVKFKTENPRHKDAIPYKKEKHKINYRDYKD